MTNRRKDNGKDKSKMRGFFAPLRMTNGKGPLGMTC
jgi:hypothetical protein